MRALAIAALLCGLSLVAGCAEQPPAPEVPHDSPAAPSATAGTSAAGEGLDDEPSDPDAIVQQAISAGATVEVIEVSEDLSMLPSACVANPVNGCLGGNSQAMVRVERAGIDRWIVELTVTWTPTSDLMRTLEARAHVFYECGFGCTAGAEETVEKAAVSPLGVHGILDETVEDAKGLWLIIDTPANLPGGSIANTGQDLHVEGRVVAIDDR